MTSENTLPEAEAMHDQPVRRVHRDGTEYVLLGTAHVSRRSAEAVREMIAAESFDAIAVELCDHRARAMREPDAIARLDLFNVIREGKVGVIAAGLALGAFQRRLAEQFGIEPGAEMRAAMDEADARQLPCWLIDRDVGLTLRRARSALGFWDKTTLTAGMIGSMVSSDEISEEDIEKLKQGDMLQSTFAEFARQSAPLYRSLIAERDQFMAARLRQEASTIAPRKVLAVLGAGHLEGIERHLNSDQQQPAELLLEVISEPKSSNVGKWLGYALIVLVLGGFAWGFSRSERLGLDLLINWTVITASMGALGALAAAAHPLSILAAAVSSPLTPLHPALASGMVSGAVEAWVRKPKVEDFAQLRDDVMHWRGWWRNSVTRVFLVFFLTSFGTSIGVWIAIGINTGKMAAHP
ncbi:MAG: TraB/GumN family protein [Pseudomonadota bacterium]|nr:TraB/GumN family protein [Pseudomonadota bacterium]